MATQINISDTYTLSEITQFSYIGNCRVIIKDSLNENVGTISQGSPLKVDVADDYTFIEASGGCCDECVGQLYISPVLSGDSSSSDGESGFYVNSNGDPIFVKSIYDEDTQSFVYADYADNPLIPGVDFFPAPSGVSEATAVGGNLDIPENSTDWTLPVTLVRTVTVIREGADAVTINYNGILTMRTPGFRQYGGGDGAALLDITDLKITTGANSQASVIWEV